MTLYRVFTFDATARPAGSGGPMFASRSGFGRIGNSDLYHELYLSSTAAGAVSEAFGRLDTWTSALFAGRDRPYALAAFYLDDRAAICDLDNAARLLAYGLAPSDVVARDRSKTQAWAARIYKTDRWVGIAWWSRYESGWQSIGLWDVSNLQLKGEPERLSVRHAAVQEAAALLPRRLELS
ncbi:MAG: RES family NAD+ phosphorylase [Candidatus Cybelea sp.]